MKTDRIRIGIIGLNPESQWAAKSHIPALRLLSDDFEITGVANSNYESAKKAADFFTIPKAYESTSALIHSADNDLIVITVRVPYHFELVKSALEAGKHVYCEHPLGNGVEETRELAALAASGDRLAVVGTQMVVSPDILYLEKLIKDGYVGNVLSTTLIGSGGVSYSGETIAANYYLSDKKNGATMLTIPLGHTLAGVIKVLGEFEAFSSLLLTNFPTVNIKDTGETKQKTTEDQIMIIGKLKSGAAISVHYRGGISRGTNLLWEINGTQGDIQVTAALGHGQLMPLTSWGATDKDKVLQPLTPPAELLEGLPKNPMVTNVLLIYKRIANDIRNNTRTAPSFQDGLNLQELLSQIEEGSTTH